MRPVGGQVLGMYLLIAAGAGARIHQIKKRPEILSAREYELVDAS